ncbi:WD40/YVTN/BNR-like repeat-containing protein [Sorangium sp. So ce542]|uniref:WD40/YVTN/BNR-like repeat-containing protein n=1 Tax=Sorangium sp. So ce542 TaxID=3133316 RepID=UPI003F642330
MHTIAEETPRPRRGTRAPRRGRLALSAAALLAAVGLAAPASANGRFPAAGLIASHPSDPSRLLVRATYGLLSTSDGGEEWRWICEPVVGFDGNEDPMVAFLADGTIIAGIFDGLSASKNGGCDWSFAPGELSGSYVIDLSADREDPSRAVLVISSGLGAGRFLTQLWETSDNADSWTKSGADLPEDFLAQTVDAAPSNRDRIYLSGRFGGPDYAGALARTDDRGATWERFDIPGSDDKRLPYIGAIDPADPDTIYVRLDGDPSDALLVSRDGGQSFATVFESQGDLLGFALSPDGATVLVGGPQDGIWRAAASSLEFTQVSGVGARCLTWTDAALFACGDEFVDGFTVGRSLDEGKSFEPLLHLDGLCGPIECAPESGAASTCTDLWGATELTIGSRQCGGAGSGSGSAAGAGSGGSSAGPAEEAGGCGCKLGAPGAASADVAAPGGRRALALALSAAGALALARRSRARARASARGPARGAR